jgi:hypothetical protein
MDDWRLSSQVGSSLSASELAQPGGPMIAQEDYLVIHKVHALG